MQALRHLSNPQRTARVVMHPAAMRYHQIAGASENKIALPMRSSTRLVNSADISYCKAESNYCHVVLTSGERILISKTLKWIEANLPARLFFRSHASYLVNVNIISTFSHDTLQLEGGTEIPVSRSRSAEVRKRVVSNQ